MCEQLQLDELYAVLRDAQNGEISEDEAIQRLERSPYGCGRPWTQSKLLLVIDVGTRTWRWPARGASGVERLAPGAYRCVDRWTQGLRHGF